jgi:sarcosine oxidase, subunit gamma
MSNVARAPVLQSPLHSFGLSAKAKQVDLSCGVWANEIPLLGYISLRGNSADAAFAEAASMAVGTRLPIDPCTLSQTGETTVLWLSPDEWMIVTPRGGHASLIKGLDQCLLGLHYQVADNSGGYTQVIIQGRNARDVLSHCTVYDLAQLGEGRVVGTTFGKSSVYLRRVSGGYCLMLRRSFADYIWRTLERAAQPYGFGIADAKVGAVS